MELSVKNRTAFGKKTGALRASGWIPAELYGRGIKNAHLSVSAKDFTKLERAGAGHGMVTLATEDGKKHPAIISDVARDHLSGHILALDFLQVRLDEKIRTRVPVEFMGEAPASKVGLVIVKVMNEMEVEALPHDLPKHITVSMESLAEVGSTIHVEDLKLPRGVKIIAADDAVVVTVADKAKEEAPAPAATVETAPGSPAPTTTTPETPAA